MLRVIMIESVLFALQKVQVFCDFTFVGGRFLQPPVVSFMKSAYYCCHLLMHFPFTHLSRPKKPDNPGKAPEDTKANRTHQAANIKGVNTVNFRVNVDFYCLSFWLLRLNKVWLKSNFCFVYCDQIIQQKSSYPLSVIHINLESFQHHPPFICAVHNGMGK